MSDLEDYLPGVRSEMKVMGARVSRHVHSVVALLVEAKMFDTKSDAIRAMMDIGARELRARCPSLRKFTKRIRNFDDAYWSVMTDINKVAALVQELDDVAAPLRAAGLSWTLFDIEKEGSTYLGIARREIADSVTESVTESVTP